MKKKSPAFTLIELLTVIAIIGILAAILIPVVGSVRDNARTAKCISNIRECGLGVLMLADTNEYRLTTFGSGSGGPGDSYQGRPGHPSGRWPSQLLYYNIVEAREVLYCPNANTIRPGDTNTDPDFPQSWSWRSYGMNMFDDGPDPSERWARFVSVFGQGYQQYEINFNAIPEPSRFILMADSVDQDTVSRFRIDRPTSGGNGSIHLLHNRRANVFFLDGHVETADAIRLGELGMISGHGPNMEVITFPQN